MLHEALARMPHCGRMRLIDRIVDASAEEITCIATPHAGADYPLRLDGVLYGATLVELGAQAAAAHASVFAIGAAHMGLVLSLSQAEVHRGRIELDGPIEICARRLRELDGASAYRFVVSAGGEALVEGEVLLSIRELPA